MRRFILAALLSACASGAWAVPTPKEELLKPPADAAHYVIVSTAGKHGDEYIWKLPDGRLAFRQSILLRGLVFETDETIRFGLDGMPADIQVRGITPSGDAAESFHVANGKAVWKSPVDEGNAAYSAPAYYLTQGGPFTAGSPQVEKLLSLGSAGMALLPSGHAELRQIAEMDVNGPQGKKHITLHLMRGVAQTPQPFWMEGDKVFGALFGLTVLPAGYEGNQDAMQKVQDAAIAAQAPATAKRLLGADARKPILFRNVKIYDAEKQRFVEGQNVVVDNGKITMVGTMLPRLPAGSHVIDGAGKTLVPGLWDSHMHMPDDFTAVSEVAIGVTSFRNPGGTIELAQSQEKRRREGTLVAPEGFTSVIIDQKGPLVAQGSIAVGSLEETLAAVRKVKAAGMTGVKFYTSMNPAWIPPAAKLAHELGLHVHGHIPAGMRTLDAINAGYDEITHVYFATMQAMPEEVVAKSNTTMRLLGPGKYFKDVDFNAEPTKTVISTMVGKHTVLDPTLVVVESVLTAEAGTVAPEYTAYMGTLPAAFERGFKAGGLPLLPGMTRADAKASFNHMVDYIGVLHKAGVPIVAGTDGYGLELVRELELYVQGGMTPGEALATATIDAARNVGIDKRTGSIAVGKEADLLLVNGDPEKNIGDLRHVDKVVLDGALLDGDALRKEAGFSGRPK